MFEIVGGTVVNIEDVSQLPDEKKCFSKKVLNFEIKDKLLLQKYLAKKFQ